MQKFWSFMMRVFLLLFFCFRVFDADCLIETIPPDEIEQLIEQLHREPGNSHDMFSLALAYKNRSNLEQAIKWLKARIEHKDGSEEFWYSKYLLGICYEEQNDWDSAFKWYLEAFQDNPNRAEPLYKMATHYRKDNQNELAYSYAKKGVQIPHPGEHALFVAEEIYQYQLDEELSYTAQYTSHPEDGFSATHRLILKKWIPAAIKECAYQNLLSYVPQLPLVSFQPIEFDRPLVRKGFPHRYQTLNPTILKTSTGYDVICRTVNYVQVNGNHRSQDYFDPKFRTRNFFLQYDSSFHLLSQNEIVEHLPRERIDTHTVGLEDCRLVKIGNEVWFTCVTCDFPGKKAGQVLCKLAMEPSKQGQFEVEQMVPLWGPYDIDIEKNWLPFVQGNDLYAIHSYDPYLVYKINRNTGICDVVIYDRMHSDFSRFRGSAPPIPFDNGYLLMVHEVILSNWLIYTHRFLYLDKNLHITRASRPFIFFHPGVEYCCGMTIDGSGTQCILALATEDSQAYLAQVNIDTIRSMLEPLP